MAYGPRARRFLFLALLLIYLFTVKLGWLPSSGMSTLGTSGSFLDVARHMVMPVKRHAGNLTAGLPAYSKGKRNRAFLGDQ